MSWRSARHFLKKTARTLPNTESFRSRCCRIPIFTFTGNGPIDTSTGKPRTGVFIVDRKGWIAWSRQTNTPQPVQNWESAVEEMIAANEI